VFGHLLLGEQTSLGVTEAFGVIDLSRKVDGDWFAGLC
jgi:hypothetical protein